MLRNIRQPVYRIGALIALMAIPILSVSCISSGLVPVKTCTSMEEAIYQLDQLERRLPQKLTDPTYSTEWDNLQVHMRKARFVARNYRPSDLMFAAFADIMSNAETELQTISQKEPHRFIPGKRTEGYYSGIDGSYQPFLRFVPKGAKRQDALPMIVFLHGYSPAHNIINWEYIPDDLVDFAEANDFIVAAPFGRSNTDFQGIGEQDVLNVIEEMKHRYRIDPDRIILAGISMGGMGAWTIGAHYPDLFAGLIVLSGRGDYYFWQKVRPQDLPTYKQNLIDTEFAFSLLPNLRNIPVFCIHGALDELVPVEEARLMVNSLRRLNQGITYVEIEDGSHSVFESAFARKDLQKWLKDRRRVVPQAFEYITFHPQYNGCHWLSYPDIDRRQIPSLVSVQKAGKNIIINATGLRMIEVFGASMPAPLRKAPAPNSRYELKYYPDMLRPLPAAAVSGPVKQAFLSPFVFVCAADPSVTSISDRFKQAAKDWYMYSKSNPRWINERDLQQQDAKNFNIFLFGEPETSALIRKVLEKAPIKITEKTYIVGDKQFPREGTGLYMIRPNPLNPAKLAVVQCGLQWGENLPPNHKYDLIPDYIVYSGQADSDGSNTALCAGFFDEKWQIVQERMYVNPGLETRVLSSTEP